MGSRARLSFSPEVAEKLNFYVYRLIDPRNGETFYVGKGKGNRVFAHSEGKAASSNENPKQSEKLELIHEIRAAGLEVTHVIHRHGLDEAAAFEVEGALLDVYPGLRNQIKGHGSSNRGVMHVQQIIVEHSLLMNGCRPHASISPGFKSGRAVGGFKGKRPPRTSRNYMSESVCPRI